MVVGVSQCEIEYLAPQVFTDLLCLFRGESTYGITEYGVVATATVFRDSRSRRKRFQPMMIRRSPLISRSKRGMNNAPSINVRGGRYGFQSNKLMFAFSWTIIKTCLGLLMVFGFTKCSGQKH